MKISIFISSLNSTRSQKSYFYFPLYTIYTEYTLPTKERNYVPFSLNYFNIQYNKIFNYSRFLVFKKMKLGSFGNRITLLFL